MNTLDLNAAATKLQMSPESLRRKAKAGQIPAAKPGKQWVFLEEDLVDWLRAQYPQRRQARQVTVGGNNPWHFTSEARPGGYVSRPHRESEYAALLGLKTERKHRSITTA
ncbi:helix-turn-helix domain-containing protein [Acidihalobacter ferrooxydans]|uniref:Helix-turn-helix domain-containing protein n=1 Tax=Acidihalobacter ferrooxydans TaxID=1765967 RepID=A0A1P8UIE0_9GAMM|nr:hypothetical protein BW247_11335 [Acidihalobacter ferrooxydans]